MEGLATTVASFVITAINTCRLLCSPDSVAVLSIGSDQHLPKFLLVRNWPFRYPEEYLYTSMIVWLEECQYYGCVIIVFYLDTYLFAGIVVYENVCWFMLLHLEIQWVCLCLCISLSVSVSLCVCLCACRLLHSGHGWTQSRLWSSRWTC